MSETDDSFHKRLAERTGELQSREDYDWSRASSVAWLEERVRLWPRDWGNELRGVLIYGDFKAPASTVGYPSLGITVLPEKQENTIVQGPRMVLEATVSVKERSVPGLDDAVTRINLLLGSYTLREWGNASCGWWSWLTHDTGGGVIGKPLDETLEKSAASVLQMSEGVRARVASALFWVREPRNMFPSIYRSDTLRIFSAYWNAFECLVEAVCVFQPRKMPSRSEKQVMIDEFFRQRGGKITAENVQDCFREIVDPGFRGKARHALEVCFGSEAASKYYEECFAQGMQSLSAIRNAINHGDIDAENPKELIRVSARQSRLWMIVWRMFGQFIPFAAPVDPEATT
ncbi:MAG: hypothetical protein GY798_07940 [Hyphomicrobiales bacterium]|nr:hypothetical protein [Hyphomicrobiales bacterium]